MCRQTSQCQPARTVDLIFLRWAETQTSRLSCNKRFINIPDGAVRSGRASEAHLTDVGRLVGNGGDGGDGTPHTAARVASHLGPANDGGPCGQDASLLILMPLG